MKETFERPTRRVFCAHVVTLAAFSGAGMLLESCGGSPTGPSAPPLPTVTGTRTASGITVTIDSTSPLASVGSAALVHTTIGDFLVAHTGPNTFAAMTATCTHQTCTIDGFQNQTFVCPCHGSTFDVNGHVLMGPAPSSLRQYATQFSNGVLTIAA
jgi:nitrite reductase/ring-hydroxylating ferredoxin subunit